MADLSKFDVFLCHNSKDKPLVRRIAQALRQSGVRYWLDEEQLQPGQPWYPELIDQLGRMRSLAVFIGRNGIGRYQEVEVENALRLAAREKIPIIPVLLPDYFEDPPSLPPFIEDFVHKYGQVDFSHGSRPAFERLVAAIGSTTLSAGEVIDILAEIPDPPSIKRAEEAFAIQWVVLHLIGFVLVAGCMYVGSAVKPGATAQLQMLIVLIAVCVSLALIFVRRRFGRARRMTFDSSGALTGVLVGLAFSIVLVRVSRNLQGFGALAGMGTAVGAGVVGGWYGGVLAGAVSGLLASVGALMAALLLPWLLAQLSTEQFYVEPTVIIASILVGSIAWFCFLAFFLLRIARRGSL